METTERKYRLLDKKISVLTPKGNREVYQIEALVDIPTIGVQKGDLGGYIANEKCLWQAGDCWIFDDSAVTDGSLVMQSAQVKGKSLIDGNSKIGGRGIIEDADILDATRILDNVLVKQSECKNCLLYGTTNIHYSHLERIEMKKGVVFDSKVESVTANRLVFHGNTHIEESQVVSFDKSHHVTCDIEMVRVKALELMAFKVKEKTYLHDVTVLGKLELRIGVLESLSINTCSIKGGGQNLLFRKGKLTLLNSSLHGQIEVKGNINLAHSAISDFCRLLNDTEKVLKLEHMKVTDCVCINKVENSTETVFADECIAGDVTVTC